MTSSSERRAGAGAGILVVVQARTGSTRLPGKILLPLAGAPLLQRMLERVRAAATPFDLVVATTVDPADDPVRGLCERIGVACFSGHPTDLLDRHYRAATFSRGSRGSGRSGLAAREEREEEGAAGAAGADSGAGGPPGVVVKIPSDCPLIDPGVIDQVLAAYLADPGRYDFVSNLHPATWPDGNDVEVIPLPALELAWREAERPHEREHTTPFLWDQPERFRIGNVTWESGRDLAMSHRFTIDYPEDYEFLAAVYDALWTPRRPIFRLEEVLRLLEERPDIFALNSRFAGVNWYRHHLGELRTVKPEETHSPEAS